MSNPANQFKERLANGEVIIIDGGMGTELNRRNVEMTTSAWAAPAVLDRKDDVRGAHEDFIRAGADVIITNTYMGSFDSLEAAGFGNRAADINRMSVEVAIEARENAADRPVLIAGSIYPGYVPEDFESFRYPTEEDGVDHVASQIRKQATTLAEAGVDVIAFEMMPTTFWGKIAMNVVAETGVPVWLGVAYSKEHQNVDGEWAWNFPLDPPAQPGALIEQVMDGTKADVMAVTLMHTQLEEVDTAITDIRATWQGPLGVYPHHCEHINELPGLRALDIAPEKFLTEARGWVDRGAQLIGGCCGIGPEHIRLLKDELPTHLSSEATK